MAGWHHRLDGPEFEYTLGVGDGQGGLACCSSWGHKESDTTEWLNWTENCFIRLKDSFGGGTQPRERHNFLSLSAPKERRLPGRATCRWSLTVGLKQRPNALAIPASLRGVVSASITGMGAACRSCLARIWKTMEVYKNGRSLDGEVHPCVLCLRDNRRAKQMRLSLRITV